MNNSRPGEYRGVRVPIMNNRNYTSGSQRQRTDGSEPVRGIGSAPSATGSKREYTSPSQQNVARYRKNQEELGYNIGRRADVDNTDHNWMTDFEAYSDENLGGRDAIEFLANADEDEMYAMVNDPTMAGYYTSYGDLSDREKFDRWFNNNENMIDLSYMANPDEQNESAAEAIMDIFSNPITVAALYGTNAEYTNMLNQALVSSGLAMSKDDGTAVTYEDLGIDPESEGAEDQYLAANLGMFNQGVLGSNIYAGMSGYYDPDSFNALAGEKIEYGLGDDYDMNNLDNPDGIRNTISNIPSYEEVWIFDPNVYERSVQEGWNTSGLGSAYSGLANLAASGAGLSYREV